MLLSPVAAVEAAEAAWRGVEEWMERVLDEEAIAGKRVFANSLAGVPATTALVVLVQIILR